MSDRRPLTRRRFVHAAAGITGGAATGLMLGRGALAGARGRGPGSQPPHLPARQHAWQATLHTDSVGNPIAPRYDRLLLFDVLGRPSAIAADRLEAALRTIERRFLWGPDGVLFCLGWSPTYFSQVLGLPSPLPPAIPLAPNEQPQIDGYHLCLHLAADSERRLAEIEAALVHAERLPGADGRLDVSSILSLRETRTGFIGAGLPAAHQHAAGLPSGSPVPPQAPLFMGFASNRRRNQASEDDVTISAGRFAGGTTMHVSLIELHLGGWYRGLSERARVARMFAPQLSVAEANRLTTDAASDPQRLDQTAQRYGMVGHAQAAAVARRGGRPLILRRDFNTVDGGHAGVHFVALQRSIADFITTRAAVNAPWAQAQTPKITETANNGINAFMTVARRANYIVPTRRDRSFPLL
jgi:hypothetical protein